MLDTPVKCEGCGEREAVRLFTMPHSSYAICDHCEARLVLLMRKHPDVVNLMLLGQYKGEVPKIPPSEISDELFRLRRLRAQGVIADRRLEKMSTRSPDDRSPWHPVPKLDNPVEPEFYPQFAHDPIACALSPADRIELHGLSVCWKSNDHELLPTPLKEEFNVGEVNTDQSGTARSDGTPQKRD
jgi:hypothetical protein